MHRNAATQRSLIAGTAVKQRRFTVMSKGFTREGNNPMRPRSTSKKYEVLVLFRHLLKGNNFPFCVSSFHQRALVRKPLNQNYSRCSCQESETFRAVGAQARTPGGACALPRPLAGGEERRLAANSLRANSALGRWPPFSALRPPQQCLHFHALGTE